MKIDDFMARLAAIRVEFGNCEVLCKKAPGDGEVVGAEVFSDTHFCKMRGCEHQHETAPKVSIIVDTDWSDY